MLPLSDSALIVALASDGMVKLTRPLTVSSVIRLPASSVAKSASTSPLTVESSAVPRRLTALTVPLTAEALVTLLKFETVAEPLTVSISLSTAPRGIIS